MSWRNKRVTIIGLGLHGGGIGTAEFFSDQGAAVIVTDIRSETVLAPAIKKLANRGITFIIGSHRYEDFTDRDLILRNPGVPPTSPYILHAKDEGILVLTDAALFLRDTTSFVVGITGTKGKTTAATLMHHAFESLVCPVELVSVPEGTPFLTALKNAPPLIVAEFSSWDLEGVHDIHKSPKIALVTNLFPDHLNRHKTMEAYAIAKSAVGVYQAPEDSIVYPKNMDSVLPIVKESGGHHIAVTEEEIAALPKLRMIGEHQKRNAALVAAAIKASFAHPQFPKTSATYQENVVFDAIAEFSGMSGRFEALPDRANRHFINDTTATNPGATIEALKNITTPIVLIAGGEGKELPYDELLSEIIQRVRHVVLLDGSASSTLQSGLKKSGYTAISAGIMDMNDAVAQAMAVSEAGDTILLSPAASSLNAYANEFDRGEQFTHAIEE